MSTSTRPNRPGRQGAGRTAAALVAAVVGAGGMAACSDDSAGPGAGGVSIEDLQEVQDDVAALEDRLGVLEDEAEAAGESDAVDDAPADPVPEDEDEDEGGAFADADELVGQEISVSATVTEVLPTTGLGSAYRIGGESGEPIPVVMATPQTELEVDDVVQVSGTIVQVQRDSFEADFGIAADELFEDAESFLADAEGRVAVAADRVEVLPEETGSG